ncbi:Chromo (CHRromatin Organization MOdifier) domain [Carpediemonas membranifera]|uniref:RNA-directed DNA polymerase n=1 Tax=Carpediemonas membranifera TaxID=201153 RepID=A0A8J6AZ07_9EUKA|nr:Chromo (CHRromatin Organization MOdifier) domain [Carpediemonas membranifera]|eukprot:KAG9389429.1 Chromo (CHRromatin Organization MOdifier) domain [Carpediemonas membranifera]
MMHYCLLYRRTLQNCCDVRPKESHLVTKFLSNISDARLRQRCKTEADKRTLRKTMQLSLTQAKEQERVRYETKAEAELKDQPCLELTEDYLDAIDEAHSCTDVRDRPIYPIHLGDHKVMALYDTGATANFLSLALAKSIGVTLNPERHRIRLATGQIVVCTHIAQLSVHFPSVTGHDLTADIKFIILPNLDFDAVIGFPTLRNTGLFEIPEVSDISILDDEEDMELDAMAEEPDEPRIELFREEIQRLLKKYDVTGDISSPSLLDPFTIRTKDAQVIKRYPYRYSDSVMKEIHRQTDTLESLRVLEPSDSPYNNPIVMAGKRNGEARMCLDFRELNKVTLDLIHPLPLIDDLVSHLEGMQFFAALDLTKAFHQVEIDPHSRPLTAFTAGKKKPQYCRMPFGLKNAPIHMQRALEKAMGGALHTKCLVYIDDIVVFGRSKEEYLANLQDVLSRLSRHGLKLNLAKSVFSATEIDYLGWHIDAHGKRVSSDRLDAIKALRPATSLTGLRALIGLANYFCALLPDYATRMEPLISLTRASKFDWGQEQDAALTWIKDRLLNEEVLVHPRPGEALHLFTDASDVGIGGVLTNSEGNPVAYFAKTLSSTQRRWSTIEKECFAIFHGITKLRRYLAGRVFEIHTDHRDLTYMHHSINAKVMRWAMALSEYDYSISHVAGVDNGAADALSRLFTLDDVPDERFTTFQAHHNGSVGHLGRDATCRKIAQAGLSWPGMKSDVRRFIGECPVCQLVRSKRSTIPSERHSLMGSYPFEVVQADSIGPMDVPGCHSYGLVVVDTFSRLTQVYPTTDTTSSEAIRVLSSWRQHYGTPATLITDGASQFCSEEFKSFCNQSSIIHKVGTPYHPAGQGSVERQNEEVKRHLRAYLLENDGTWEEGVNQITSIINNAPLSTSQLSPNQVLFGKEVPIPAGSLSMELFYSTLQALRSEQLKMTSRQSPTATHAAEHLVGQGVIVRRNTTGHVITRGPCRIIRKTERPNVYIVRDFTLNKDFEAHADSLTHFRGTYTDKELADWAARHQGEYLVRSILAHRV